MQFLHGGPHRSGAARAVRFPKLPPRPRTYQIADDVQAKRLQIVLPDYEPPPLPVHAIHREGKRPSARVRAFVDFSVERLRAEPSLAQRRA